MSLQTDDLAMIGLGVVEDEPANTYQATLVDGIHLRWVFARDLGFPWHGFYLFRRRAGPGRPLCLSRVTGGLGQGSWPDNKHYTALGLLSSNADLELTEDFAPGDQVEFALDGRDHLRFDLHPGELARRFELRIGFRHQRCLDFKTLIPPPTPSAPGESPPSDSDDTTPGASVTRSNPFTLRGVTFEVKDSQGNPASATRFDFINTTSGPLFGLGCEYGLTIRLPAPSNAVELLLTYTITAATIEAFSGGNKVATAQMHGPPNQPTTIQLSAQSITRIEVLTLRNVVRLHQLCSDTFGVADATATVKVTAFAGVTPVRSVNVNGQAGQIVSVTLEADALDAVEIGPGPALLVDLCYLPVAQDATQGWEPLDGFSYPMGLPVSQADYPCSIADPESLLQARVRYELPPGWDDDPNSFTELHAQLVKLVEGGPGSAPMADRIFVAPPEASSPPDPNPPQLGTFYVLDLILFGTLHPALAQLIGLSWVDQTAAPNTAYDYLIVADHTGVGERRLETVLAVIESSGFTQLDGYIVFNKRRAAEPPLQAPGDLQTYALPGGIFPDVQGRLPQSSNNAGLRWDIGADDSGALLPERAVMYLVWRADLGNGATPAPVAIYNLITKRPPDEPNPLLVTEPRLPNGAAPQRSPEWPPEPLHFIDRNLPDGWYSYRVSGIDLVGRHSVNSEPSLLRVLDRIAPPMPTAVEAYALDPADPFLQRDGAYRNWHTSLPESVRDTLVGLRVRWRWTTAHQQQAPDTNEFRIYFHPGAALALDRDQAIKWHERYYVVDYEDVSSIDAVGGDRVYEVFIPPANAQSFTSLPLNPSSAEPVVYAHVGVSAADDKPHTSDQRTTGDWSNRPGNEGFVGPPAKIYRVLRTRPARPVVLEDTERVDASPADYHNRSFYTYRWQTPNEADNLKLHLFRALDDAVFKTDWFIRTTRVALDPGNPLHQRFFPNEWNEDATRQQAAASRLNAITSPADYQTLTDDARDLLACLPGNDGVKDLAGLERRDWSIRRTRRDLSADDLTDFPGWDAAKRQAVAAELNAFILSGDAATAVGNEITLDGTADLSRVRSQRDTVLLKGDTRSANRQYRIDAVDILARTLTLDDAPTLTGGASAWAIPLYQTLSDNALRALTILPSNEAAFTQVTLAPLDSYEADPHDSTQLRWRDRLGPDNPDDFPLHPDPGARRAYIDTLDDGRSTNRYFYRAAFLDGAHNQSDLSPVGPAVYLPNVVPPRQPAWVNSELGDASVTLHWVSNREADLIEYQVFRTENGSDARDIRLMQKIHTLTVPADAPDQRPASVSWTDANLIGGKQYLYRIVAVDVAGNVSTPSEVFAVTAVDTRIPDPPTWLQAGWVILKDEGQGEEQWPADGVIGSGESPAIRLPWQSDVVEGKFALARRIRGEHVWKLIAGENDYRQTSTSEYLFYDRDVSPDRNYSYRIRVTSPSDISSLEYRELGVARPRAE